MNTFAARATTKTFGPVGECIYCGSMHDLTDEHIIPYGLHGDMVLPRASCRICATITSKFELKVLRGPLQWVRSGLELKSRTPRKGRPTSLPLGVTRDGATTIESVPIGDNLHTVILPIYGQPGFLLEAETAPGIITKAMYTGHYNHSPDEVRANLRAEAISLQLYYPAVEFARMVAKIAYAYAVGVAGIEVVRGARPVSAILGKANNIGAWVGTVNEAVQPLPSSALHTVSLLRDQGHIAATVCLFSEMPAPLYLVLLKGAGDACRHAAVFP
ncbi:hypothetical protein [Peristeroidobacter soli]|uniref:hypothetical protein n=1 Tax=Peristeroidobacter soli TaxID=2497877 RepID=UPI00101CA904|nr:hypothetical protein [Peristeroidobacter soli]